MLGRVELAPVSAGVIYSPGGAGWLFYPEDRLFVGTTGSRDYATRVRSRLVFDANGLPEDALVVRADLVCAVIACEPPDAGMEIDLREPPSDGPWELGEELAGPVLARCSLSGGKTEAVFDLTGMLESWRGGGSNRGILLASRGGALCLATIGNGRPQEPCPRLAVRFVRPAAGSAPSILNLPPGALVRSADLHCGGVLIRNHGPGSVGIRPLFRFKRGRPLDPDGSPPLTISPGGGSFLESPWPGAALIVVAAADALGARVELIQPGGRGGGAERGL